MHKTPSKEVFQQEIAEVFDMLIELMQINNISDAAMIVACSRIYCGIFIARGFPMEMFEESMEAIKKDYATRLEDAQST